MWFGCGVYWPGCGVCLKLPMIFFLRALQEFWRGSLVEEHSSIHILSWKQLSSPQVNFQSYFELDWFYDLFLYSSEFGMYWSTLLWSREAIFSFLASGAVACICCLLVFFLFFIYDLNQERNDYHPWVNWTSGRRATAVAPSVCLSVWTVPRRFFLLFIFLDTSNEADHRKSWVTLPPNRPTLGRTFLNSFPVYCALFHWIH